MSVSILDHTADIGIEVISPSYPALFIEAAFGMLDLILERTKIEIKNSVTWEAEGFDLIELLQAFLSEVLFTYECDHWVPKTIQITSLSLKPGHMYLQAIGEGEHLSPKRDRIKSEIKAVTYHDLTIEPGPANNFYARIIFDL